MANKIEKRLKRELEINIVDIFDSPINRKFYFVRQISSLSANLPIPLLLFRKIIFQTISRKRIAKKKEPYFPPPQFSK